MKDATYYPVWVEQEGTEWVEDAIPEQCEHGGKPFDPDNFDPVRAKETLSRAPSDDDCTNHVEFVGQRGKIRIQLCRKHFEEAIQPGCRVRWDEFVG